MSGTAEISYLYAVTRAPGPGPDPFEGVRGVGGRPVRTVECDGLAAVVSAVPAAEFDEEALKERFEDLVWLEEVARAHHTVVDAVTRSAVAVPLRLATLYRDDERVRRVLEREHAAFDSVLRRLDGRVEFAVKVFSVPTSPTEDAPAERGPGSGREYLRRRRERHRRRDEGWRLVGDLCDRIDAELLQRSRDRRTHRPQSAALSRVEGENVMNAAYLVDEEDVASFLGAVGRLREQAPGEARVEVSGPWAPYSFASLEMDGEGS
ncbi:GvpL/GvpF family gas vesicle protein [Nocardiopsis lambiniae]|uniref:GvpL/GvpF family gas vesicle protein n=1 Tax=Nocardiopsis lambiniae TaxID=3075539 RepID=A0ABU2M6L3_9ACTN|nr:GvpL/GvpF family gas vesicle protein [Nocardiopsis sp. DSM 44743]MDT0328305.1 GvpL/GvpF family gas vesicle protein [Nocardiopsis sp. DSM 44743]